MLEEKIVNQEFYNQQNNPSEMKEKLRDSQIKIEGVCDTRLVLQEMLNKVLQAKMKRQWTVT